VKEELAGMLPFAPIASLLIELDHRTGYLSCFTHAGGRKRAMSGEVKRNILAVLIANATNLGLVKMAEACGVPYDVLAWTQEWYVREETLREANTVIVNHHHGLAFARVFGGGTMSSSDGQRFPTRGKSLTARAMNTFFADEGLSTYTHVSDQHSTFGTKVIVPTTREAHYVLDDFLGNATDLPIAEHATDTHGVTLINFALFDLVGKALTPRIRDLGKVTLCRDDTPTVINARYPHAGPLLTDRLDQDLIVEVCFSFGPMKNLTSGEGGAIVPHSPDQAATLRRMRTVGIAQTLAQRSTSTSYDVIGFGVRAHLSSLFAAIGLAQLADFDQARTVRRQLWHRYATALAGLPDVELTDVDIDHTVPFNLVVQVPDRDRIFHRMRAAGIGVGVHYPPNHLQPAFAAWTTDLPNTEEIGRRILSLPFHPSLSIDDVDQVVAALRAALTI